MQIRSSAPCATGLAHAIPIILVCASGTTSYADRNRRVLTTLFASPRGLFFCRPFAAFPLMTPSGHDALMRPHRRRFDFCRCGFGADRNAWSMTLGRACFARDATSTDSVTIDLPSDALRSSRFGSIGHAPISAQLVRKATKWAQENESRAGTVASITESEVSFRNGSKDKPCLSSGGNADWLCGVSWDSQPSRRQRNDKSRASG
jgi:hypothetical protein